MSGFSPRLLNKSAWSTCTSTITHQRKFEPTMISASAANANAKSELSEYTGVTYRKQRRLLDECWHPVLEAVSFQRNLFLLANSCLMDPGHLPVKNTFIQVPVEDSLVDSSEALPRAFSDQSHVRRSLPQNLTSLPPFPGIPEDQDDNFSDRTSSFNRLDTSELERLRTLSRPTADSSQQNHFNPPLLTMLTGFHSPAVTVPSTYGFPVSTALVHASIIRAVTVGDHRWHEESSSMGRLDEGRKEFTKIEFEGRLSMVTESVIHRKGTSRYLVLILSGPVSVADGFGFVFSSTLPCKKNIQKIDSVFMNQKGRICSRTGNELQIFNNSSVGYIEVGSIVEIQIDLDSREAFFALYSPPRGLDAETLSILVRDEKTFSNWLVGSATMSIDHIDAGKTMAGHFCAVLKNKGITVRFL